MSGLNLDTKQDRLTRTAFVTIGATAGFRGLLQEVVSQKFLFMLKSLNFTNLVVQCGPDLEYFDTIRPRHAQESCGVEITAFSYAPELKKYFMQASRGEDENGKRDCGVIISHAGSFEYSTIVRTGVAYPSYQDLAVSSRLSSSIQS